MDEKLYEHLCKEIERLQEKHIDAMNMAVLASIWGYILGVFSAVLVYYLK